MSTARLLQPLLLAALVQSAVCVEPEGLPEPAQPREMAFAKPEETTLANGLRVIAVERPGLPMISAGLLIRSGAEADPPKLSGLAQFTGSLLTRGTTKRSATEIAQDLEDHGAALKIEANWDLSLAMLTTLSSEAKPSLRILAEIIRKPAFAPAEIERLRKETIDELTVSLEQPGQLARTAAARAILGTQPYGHAVTGVPSSLRRMKRKDIVNFHTRTYQPDQAVLIVAGSLPAKEVFALTEAEFGDWKPANPAGAKSKGKSRTATKPATVLIDMPDAGQAAVYVGRETSPRHNDDYYIGQVANSVLGGGFSARLNREIRIRRGLSYGCGSRLSAYRGAGIFGAATQTKNESAAEVVEAIRLELAKLGDEPIPEVEFAARVAVITGSFQRNLETNEGYVKCIADYIVHEKPANSFALTLEKLKQVTPGEVQAFAKKEFSPDLTSVVVVGNAAKCEKGLRETLPGLRKIPQADLDLESPRLTSQNKAN